MGSREEEALQPYEWLVGALGLWAGSPGYGWRRLGPSSYFVNAMHVQDARSIVVAADGLWQAGGDPGQRWLQLHDELLTEVMAVTVDPEAGTIAAGTYGVAVATDDEIGIPRWRSLTQARSPDERFSNAIAVVGTGHWLVGTEAGVMVTEDGGAHWTMTNLSGTPVRALHHVNDRWWAGTDDRGLWSSADGHAWEPASVPTPAVFSISDVDARLLLGGYDGIYAQTADGGWSRSGPRVLVRALGVAAGQWLAGADPGGLWVSADEGGSWSRSGSFDSVRALRAPGSRG